MNIVLACIVGCLAVWVIALLFVMWKAISAGMKERE